MNKAILLCSIGLICSTFQIQAAKSNTPSWSSTMDTILSSIEELTDAITNDSLLYDNVRNSLEQLHDEFDICDIARKEMFESLCSDITEIHVTIQNSHTASQAALAAALLREQKLLQQLSALKLETEAEIAHLNRLVATISHELAETQQTYTELIKVNQTKTDELIRSLSVACNTYETMAVKRADFLDSLTMLVDLTKAYLQKSITETEELCQRISTLTDATLVS